MPEIENEKVQTSTFDLVLQSVAIIVFICLIVVDKGLGVMAKPIPDLWYGIIGAFGFGGIDLLKWAISKK